MDGPSALIRWYRGHKIPVMREKAMNPVASGSLWRLCRGFYWITRPRIAWEGYGPELSLLTQTPNQLGPMTEGGGRQSPEHRNVTSWHNLAPCLSTLTLGLLATLSGPQTDYLPMSSSGTRGSLTARQPWGCILESISPSWLFEPVALTIAHGITLTKTNLETSSQRHEARVAHRSYCEPLR
jgi:hypothetical protein